jgi:pimeloyl-ACP methyl ester carboxylesterase
VTAVRDARSAPLQLAAPWGGTGWVSDLDGPVHWVDFGGPDPDDTSSGEAEGRPVVMVHGLGGSHLNWVGVAPELSRRHHVYAVDLAGFGLTPGTPRSSSVHANAELVARFIREVVGVPVVLVGNSMGGMVSILLAAAHPELVAGLVLVDPALPVPRQRPDLVVSVGFVLYATPFVGERVVALRTSRTTDRQRVQGLVELCFADPRRADHDVVEAGVVLAGHRRAVPGQEAAFLGAARSLMRVLARPRRYHSLMRGIDRPVLLVHGDRDRLVPVGGARAASTRNPAWEVHVLPGVGHTPQLEAPDEVLSRLIPWLESHDFAPQSTSAPSP